MTPGAQDGHSGADDSGRAGEAGEAGEAREACQEGGAVRPGRPAGVPVSVVVPARNAAGTLGRQLDALAGQDFPGRWEVVVVNDGSADDTAEVAESRRSDLPDLRVVTVRDGSGGVNRARNTGCQHSRGELLLFCDADDIVTPGWMAALVRALGHAPAAGGALERRTLNGPAALAARPQAAVPALADSFGFLKYPWGANCAVRRELWQELGGFDASYTYGSDDVEFFWRAQLAGAELAFAPDAVVHYQLRDRPWQMARQYYRYGLSHPMLYRRFGAHGMPRSSASEACREWGLLALRACRPRRHGGKRTVWLVRTALRAGRLTGSLRHRVCYL